MRNINIADPWQIAFYRALAFIFPITLILFHQHGLGIVTNIKKIGYPGMVGGFFLMLAQLLFIQSIANTSIANALFTLSSIPFITAILAFIFLKEKISLRTIIIMFFAFMGIFIMIKDGLGTGGFYGNFLALVCAFSFSASDLSSFDEGLSYFHRMKKHSSRRFREITKILREEGKKRKEEQRKEMDARG